MQRLGIGLLLTAWAGVGIGAEPDLPCENVADPTALSTMCGYAKPEDVQFMASKSAVIISEQGWKAPSEGGSISVVDIDGRAVRFGRKHTLWPAQSHSEGRSRPIGDPGCTTPPAASFSPHGLSVLEQRSSVRLAIINHAGRESVELFDVLGSRDALALEWQGCVPLPPGTTGNDVTIHPDGRLFVTNYGASVMSIVAALRGEVTGDVMEWSAERGWRHLPGTGGAMPNGIVLDARGRRLYVAELGKQRVIEFELGRDGSTTRRAEFAFRDMADDLNWTARGTILVGGQVRRDTRSWSVAEIDLRSGTVRSLFEQQTAIHSVTSATDVGGGIVFGSTGDQRIAIARWPKRP